MGKIEQASVAQLIGLKEMTVQLRKWFLSFLLTGFISMSSSGVGGWEICGFVLQALQITI